MAAGTFGLLGIFTSQGDDLHDLFASEGGRSTGPRLIGQQGFDQLSQLLILRVSSFGSQQAVLSSKPARTPEPHLGAVEGKLGTNSGVGGTASSEQDEAGASDKPLWGSLASHKPLQEGLLASRNYN